MTIARGIRFTAWMFHCHVNDHLTAGMTALYRVLDNGTGACPE